MSKQKVNSKLTISNVSEYKKIDANKPYYIKCPMMELVSPVDIDNPSKKLVLKLKVNTKLKSHRLFKELLEKIVDELDEKVDNAIKEKDEASYFTISVFEKKCNIYDSQSEIIQNWDMNIFENTNKVSLIIKVDGTWFGKFSSGLKISPVQIKIKEQELPSGSVQSDTTTQQYHF